MYCGCDTSSLGNRCTTVIRCATVMTHIPITTRVFLKSQTCGVQRPGLFSSSRWLLWSAVLRRPSYSTCCEILSVGSVFLNPGAFSSGRSSPNVISIELEGMKQILEDVEKMRIPFFTGSYVYLIPSNR